MRTLVAVGTYTEVVQDLPDHARTPSEFIGKGVHLLEVDQYHRMTDHGCTFMAPNPSVVAFHPSYPLLLAISEIGFRPSTLTVAKVVLDFQSKPTLRIVSREACVGFNASHIAIDETGTWVGVSFFLGGGLQLWRFNAGEIDRNPLQPVGTILEDPPRRPKNGGLMLHFLSFVPRADSTQTPWLIALDTGHDDVYVFLTRFHEETGVTIFHDLVVLTTPSHEHVQVFYSSCR